MPAVVLPPNDPTDGKERATMAQVIAAITTSVDGYITGPDDGPGNGLGDGGERLHYWVFGGPWSYDSGPKGEPTGEARELLDRAMARTGAIVVGRWMYEAAGHWGDKNPWDVPVFVVTHRPQEQPDTGEFTFVGGFDAAIERARQVAGDHDVAIGGGADVIRQGLEAGVIDELAIIVAPVILGGGKPLFDGFTRSLDLEPAGVRQLDWATVLEYRVKHAPGAQR
jgi:dihydrofolate reductase